jgi:hypothetical protein
LYKIREQEGRTGSSRKGEKGRRGGDGPKMCTHVNKCKNNERKSLKKF